MSRHHVSRTFRKLAAIRQRNVEREAAAKVAAEHARAEAAIFLSRLAENKRCDAEDSLARFIAKAGGWDCDVRREITGSDNPLVLCVKIAQDNFSRVVYGENVAFLEYACQGLVHELKQCIVKLLTERPEGYRANGFDVVFNPSRPYGIEAVRR
jgi:hypothetical protein